MKRMQRIMLAIGCVFLLLVSWLAAVTAETDAEKQAKLITQANAYLEDGIYVYAAPLLEEASGYEDIYTMDAEEILKEIYLGLADKSDYRQRYINLLEKQMAREAAPKEVFQEAAQYYLDRRDLESALAVLRDGIQKTGDPELVEQYEENRYAFSQKGGFYQNVTSAYNGAIQVQRNDLWGLATASGSLVIPCEYDQISTLGDDKAIVLKDGVVSAVNSGNDRVGLLHGDATEIGNYSDNRIALKTSQGWELASGDFALSGLFFEEIGLFANGYAPVKVNGKWGVVGTDGTSWLIQPECEDIIRDELGQCLSQNAIFIKQNGAVRLLVGGEAAGESYEDARPFIDGWAAVKKNGKWGFIDTSGTVQIDFQFDDALSFSHHLAAVKQGEMWGYVSLLGKVVIEPQFIDVRSFYNGSAPILTDAGWQFITLIEYESSGGLL